MSGQDSNSNWRIGLDIGRDFFNIIFGILDSQFSIFIYLQVSQKHFQSLFVTNSLDFGIKSSVKNSS